MYQNKYTQRKNICIKSCAQTDGKPKAAVKPTDQPFIGIYTPLNFEVKLININTPKPKTACKNSLKIIRLPLRANNTLITKNKTRTEIYE